MKLVCGLSKIEQPWSELGQMSLKLQGYDPLFRLLLGGEGDKCVTLMNLEQCNLQHKSLILMY
jgi:hypothetical protein